MKSPSLQLRTQHLLLQKSGQAFSDCEDAIGINGEAFRYAVADGATEAFDAQNWARRLAQQWAQENMGAALTLEDFRAWVEGHGKCLHDSWSGLRLAWYAEEKSRGGSYAAFVGIQFSLDGPTPSWQAIALGDSCLIHCRGQNVLRSLPLSDYRSFNTAPVLVPSLGSLQGPALAEAVISRGGVEAGDVFLLLSDAAAAWYLMLWENLDSRRAELEALLAASSHDELLRFIEAERLSNRMKDDDVAILRIEVACE
ncbi:MAG TPA: hypothetical protein VF553_21555 [Pyrinomonadaceae bacterium]|jgi:hypothetical protein